MSELAPSRVLRDESVLKDGLVRELLEARLVGVLSTYDPGGFIHAVPMWYAGGGEAVIFATSSRSRKTRNVERDPRATLVLHDSRSGYEVCGASIVGVAEVVGAPDAHSLVDLAHARYVAGEARSDPRVLPSLESDDVALVLRPRAAVTWDQRGSVAAQLLRAHDWALPLVSTEPRT